MARSSAPTPRTSIEDLMRKTGDASVAQSVGAIGAADNALDGKNNPTDSPAFQSVWHQVGPKDISFGPNQRASAAVEQIVDATKKAAKEKRILGADGFLAPEFLKELAGLGFFGVFVPQELGGLGLKFREYIRMERQLAEISFPLAAMISGHSLIGAVNPLRLFGSATQKQKWLELLATGKLVSGFAATEPKAGVDITRVQMRATLAGDQVLLSGSKLFITNADYGSLVSVVAQMEDPISKEKRLRLVLAQLPDADTETFSLQRYKVTALQGCHNNGFRFRDFAVPKENLFDVSGLVALFAGLNYGRVNLAAMLSGVQSAILKSLVPWIKERQAFGRNLEKWQLTQRRIGRIASNVAISSALAEMGAEVLESGRRGEFEGLVAKVVSSEAFKESEDLAVRLFGARSFLPEEHLIGRMLTESHAACIYEGENEMLLMNLAKKMMEAEHGKMFEPLNEVLGELKVKKVDFTDFKHLKTALPVLVDSILKPYLAWAATHAVAAGRPRFLSLSEPFAAYATWAERSLRGMAGTFDRAMQKHQLELLNKEELVIDLGRKVAYGFSMLVTALWGHRQTDPALRNAAALGCEELKVKLSGKKDYEKLSALSAEVTRAVSEGRFFQLDATEIPQLPRMQ